MEKPIATPRIPVVKGKMISSLGWINNKRSIVTKYDRNPCLTDTDVAKNIGKVVMVLKKKPIPGIYPPADWNMAANVLNIAVSISFVLGNISKESCLIRKKGCCQYGTALRFTLSINSPPTNSKLPYAIRCFI